MSLSDFKIYNSEMHFRRQCSNDNLITLLELDMYELYIANDLISCVHSTQKYDFLSLYKNKEIDLGDSPVK